MRRVVVMTLAYNRASFVAEALERLEPGIEHVLVDVGYPIPSRTQNSQDLIELALKRGSTYIRTPNRSVSKNWTFVHKLLGLKRGDILIGLDPDSRPREPGWVDTIVKVFDGDPSVAMVTLGGAWLMLPQHVNKPFSTEIVNGVEARFYHELIQWPLMSFECGFIEDCGGLGEWNAVYGYSEHWAEQRMGPLGRRWCVLPNIHDDCAPCPDPLYETWKELGRVRRVNCTFEEWLESRGNP